MHNPHTLAEPKATQLVKSVTFKRVLYTINNRCLSTAKLILLCGQRERFKSGVIVLIALTRNNNQIRENTGFGESPDV